MTNNYGEYKLIFKNEFAMISSTNASEWYTKDCFLKNNITTILLEVTKTMIGIKENSG